MRFSAVAVAATFIASASASALNSRQIPSCATPCLVPIAQQVSSCNIQDNTCLCKDEGFVTASTQCIVNTCTGSDLQNAIAASESLCRAFGVTLTGTIPTAASTIQSAASNTASGASATATSPTTSQSASSSGSAPAPSQSNGALANTVSGAVAGLVAVGVAALVL